MVIVDPMQYSLTQSAAISCQQVTKMAKAAQKFGMKRALVVHSKGLDEISPLGMHTFKQFHSVGATVLAVLAQEVPCIFLVNYVFDRRFFLIATGPGYILDVTPEKIEKMFFDPCKRFLLFLLKTVKGDCNGYHFILVASICTSNSYHAFFSMLYKLVYC